MSLQVYTARVGCKDSDAFDVSRKSGTAGLFLAPSWTILRPALDARRTGDEDIEREAWERYVPAYLDEMRHSYKRNRAQWDALLARSRIVALCYCTNGRYRCHRGLLAEQILTKLGAIDGGELLSEPAQNGLFG